MSINELIKIGVKPIRINKSQDERGTFQKILDSRAGSQMSQICEISIVQNSLPNTLRGIHYQAESFAEEKLVACISGEIFDVLVDLRTIHTDIPLTYSVWLGDDHDIQALVIPEYFAHGYLSTSSSSTILYAMNKPYEQSQSFGLKWDDPHLKIDWPSMPEVISPRDSAWEQIVKGF
jgi:dTDP-4-dehydrorhamnose 3,5-epimerase